MDFNTIAKSIWGQFVTVWNVPVPFIAAMTAGYFLIRWLLKIGFETRLANAASIEKLLERQLQEYKDKTGTDTPDAVVARIDALEARVVEMGAMKTHPGPRKVTADQRQMMVPLLDSFKGQSIDIASDAASADAAQMSKGLAAAFNSSGWFVQTPMVLGLGNPPPTGIGLTVPDPKNLTPPQNAVVNALRAANLEFDFEVGKLREAAIAQITLTTRLED